MASDTSTSPMTTKPQMINYLASGCKPRDQWRIGTEHEKFGYHINDYTPLEYDGPNGVRALLEGLTQFGWEPILENGLPIALKDSSGGFISLEPAGQIELSGAPLETIHQTCGEVATHLQQVKAVARELGVLFLGLGYRPDGISSEMPWMPKGRYEIMRRYMPTKGNLGLEMMQSTCTVQVNLDFDSEANMIKMFRVALALQPIATALWANSPFKEGKPNGFLSYRSHIWTDTDPDRSGTLPFVFEDGFGFERYVDYILDVPMYFVYRDGKYIDASGHSFKDFMKGNLAVLPGELPTLADWEDHLTTAFPEVRLKKFLEMRGADGGPWSKLCALPAFWVGLLYHQPSLDAAWDMVSEWTEEEREAMRAQAPRTALKTPFRNQTFQDLALDALKLSHQGLKSRAKIDSLGMDEAHYLNPLFKIAETGQTQADELLSAYNNRWHGKVDPVYCEYSY